MNWIIILILILTCWFWAPLALYLIGILIAAGAGLIATITYIVYDLITDNIRRLKKHFKKC